jgi:hypothetical protein
VSTIYLKYDITPKNAPRFAADIVRLAKSISGVDLDYSVESLTDTDAIIEGFRQDGCDADSIAATLFAYGCYVGEVFVRHAGCKWRKATKHEMDEVFGQPLLLQQGKDKTLNPIGKVFKRLTDGEEHNLPYFYRVFSGRLRKSK